MLSRLRWVVKFSGCSGHVKRVPVRCSQQTGNVHTAAAPSVRGEELPSLHSEAAPSSWSSIADVCVGTDGAKYEVKKFDVTALTRELRIVLASIPLLRNEVSTCQSAKLCSMVDSISHALAESDSWDASEKAEMHRLLSSAALQRVFRHFSVDRPTMYLSLLPQARAILEFTRGAIPFWQGFAESLLDDMVRLPGPKSVEWCEAILPTLASYLSLPAVRPVLENLHWIQHAKPQDLNVSEISTESLFAFGHCVHKYASTVETPQFSAPHGAIASVANLRKTFAVVVLPELSRRALDFSPSEVSKLVKLWSKLDKMSSAPVYAVRLQLDFWPTVEQGDIVALLETLQALITADIHELHRVDVVTAGKMYCDAWSDVPHSLLKKFPDAVAVFPERMKTGLFSAWCHELKTSSPSFVDSMELLQVLSLCDVQDKQLYLQLMSQFVECVNNEEAWQQSTALVTMATVFAERVGRPAPRLRTTEQEFRFWNIYHKHLLLSNVVWPDTALSIFQTIKSSCAAYKLICCCNTPLSSDTCPDSLHTELTDALVEIRSDFMDRFSPRQLGMVKRNFGNVLRYVFSRIAWSSTPLPNCCIRLSRLDPDFGKHTAVLKSYKLVSFIEGCLERLPLHTALDTLCLLVDSLPYMRGMNITHVVENLLRHVLSKLSYHDVSTLHRSTLLNRLYLLCGAAHYKHLSTVLDCEGYDEAVFVQLQNVLGRAWLRLDEAQKRRLSSISECIDVLNTEHVPSEMKGKILVQMLLRYGHQVDLRKPAMHKAILAGLSPYISSLASEHGSCHLAATLPTSDVQRSLLSNALSSLFASVANEEEKSMRMKYCSLLIRTCQLLGIAVPQDALISPTMQDMRFSKEDLRALVECGNSFEAYAYYTQLANDRDCLSLEDVSKADSMASHVFSTRSRRRGRSLTSETLLKGLPVST